MNREKITVLGICGRSGSGKGYVCGVFNQFGIPSIDTDSVYKSLVIGCGDVPSPCLMEITDAFGSSVLDEKGDLNKAALADIVFASGNASRLKQLNAITHKHIKEKTLQMIALLENAGNSVVLIDAPLLFESGFDRLCDLKFYVHAPLELSVKRICERDGITEEHARRRLNAQMSDSALKMLCDGVIENDGIADVRMQVVEIIQKFALNRQSSGGIQDEI